MIYPGVWIAVFRGHGSPYSFTHYVNMLGLGVRTDAYRPYSDDVTHIIIGVSAILSGKKSSSASVQLW